LQHINLKESSEKIKQQFGEQNVAPISKVTLSENKQVLIDTDFVHLHNHTQFSVLQSTISVAALVKAASQNKMPAVAITDHANLMVLFILSVIFYTTIKRQNLKMLRLLPMENWLQKL
jgi:DNA polymerase-3 subunit alpha